MINELAQSHSIQLEFGLFDVHAVPKVCQTVITEVGAIGFRRGYQVSNNGGEHLGLGYELTLNASREPRRFRTAGVDPLPQYLNILGRKFDAALSLIAAQRQNAGLESPDEFGAGRISRLDHLGRQQTCRIPNIETVGIGSAVASEVAAVLLENRQGLRIQVGRGLAKALGRQ